MKVHAIVDAELSGVADVARAAEDVGYDGVWVTEAKHDPFLALALAAEPTREVQLGTAVAVAFPRSPTHIAQTAHELHQHSNGRFILGLGSQVKAHVERRFGSTWTRPVARMRELVQAVRAVWDTWNTGERLRFEGEFYELTLMTPFFSPEPVPFGPPPVYLGALGPQMAAVAGEVADGLLVHGFTTERYLRETLLPAVEQGLSRRDGGGGRIEVSRQLFCVSGRDERELAAAADDVRKKLAFYGSTPAYRRVLELHGWGELQEELAALARRGAWSEMGGLIDDEVLETFAVVAPPERVAERILERFGDVVDRVSFNVPFREDPELWTEIIADLQQRGTSSPGMQGARQLSANQTAGGR